MDYKYTKIRKFDHYLYRVATTLPLGDGRKIYTTDPMPLSDARSCRDSMEKVARSEWAKQKTK